MPENTNKKTILVVDDAPGNIDSLSAILKPEYRVKVALSGKKALEIVDKSAPDAILLDVIMPEMDGYEVCYRLKSDPVTKNIPVIFVSGNEIDSTKEKEMQVVGTIIKPVNPHKLKAMLEQLM